MLERENKVPCKGGNIIGDYLFCPHLTDCPNKANDFPYRGCNNCLETRNCCRYRLPAHKCEFKNPCPLLEKHINNAGWLKEYGCKVPERETV